MSLGVIRVASTSRMQLVKSCAIRFGGANTFAVR
jgi:hypothetical protein